MSKVQPTRPGAVRRPGAPSVAGSASQGKSKGPSIEELRALPAFVEDNDAAANINVDVDPDNAASGKIVEETVTIAEAKYGTRTWQRKDGSFPENSFPDIALIVKLKRDGQEDDARPYEQGFKFGSPAYFVPTKDGNFVRVRAGVVKEGGSAPRPLKTSEAMIFLDSLKKKGGTNLIEKLKTEGAKALVGLRVGVKLGRVDGMNEKAKDVLLVQFIEGVKAPEAPAVKSANVEAPKVQQAAAPEVKAEVAPVSTELTEVQTLAIAALQDILGAAGGKVGTAMIPSSLIQLEKWKTHAQRGPILKALRDEAFIGSRDGVDWDVDTATATVKKID